MTAPDAYCFHQQLDPAPAREFRFDRHYLLYAAEGALRLEAGGRRWTLPPARAALIAADLPFTVTLTQRVTAASVLFAPGFGTPPAPLSVFAMTPLARALVAEVSGVGADHGPLPDHDATMFRALFAAVARLARTPEPTSLPVPRTDAVARALALIEATPEDPPDATALARAAGLTQRTLARRFRSELGMTRRQAIQRLRMIRAVERLADPAEPVTAIAFGLGYASLSAFNAAFRDFAGQSPTDYRRGFRP
ncbi:helix-turn-helix domain-containing protein [Rhodobacterales bacterium HKCCE2091]|nr:helix-turn-helix domain-containing protein [Rhodobacterales bacterium HKCCE2091]